MGIRERRLRHKDDLRRTILDAARELFVREGFADVTMRRIAERIEYSPGAIYTYFPSKDEILCALAQEGFERLSSDRNWARLERSDPLETLRAVFRRLYEFSKQEPQYFTLMFFERSIPRIAREHAHFGQILEQRKRLMATLEHCQEAGVLPRRWSPVELLRILSMGVFGVAALRLSGRIPPAEADSLIDAVLAVTIDGLTSRDPGGNGPRRPKRSAL